jgi:ABC-type branched-subunit amino acid transport system ATPase component
MEPEDVCRTAHIGGHTRVRIACRAKKKCEVLICLAKQSKLYIFDEPLAGIGVNRKHVVIPRSIWIEAAGFNKSHPLPE